MIRVVIQREIAEGLEGAYEIAARDTLQKAVSAPGYIAGESLQDMNTPNNRFIFTKWNNLHDWYSWAQSDSRKDMMTKIRPMLNSDEKIILLENA